MFKNKELVQQLLFVLQLFCLFLKPNCNIFEHVYIGPKITMFDYFSMLKFLHLS